MVCVAGDKIVNYKFNDKNKRRWYAKTIKTQGGIKLPGMEIAMKLKEAFRYMNYLDSLNRESRRYLTSRENSTIITETHYKSKANPEAADEVLTNKQLRENWNQHKDIMLMVAFCLDLLREKRELSVAVAKVKAEQEFRLDTELAINKARQELLSELKMTVRSSASGKRIRSDKAYKFNAEGNQVPYYYQVEETVEPAFDVQRLKAKIRELQNTADEVSAEADAVLVNTEIAFNPKYNLSDTFDDAFEAFLA